MKNSLAKTQLFNVKKQSHSISVLFFLVLIILSGFITFNSAAKENAQTKHEWRSHIASDKPSMLSIMFIQHLSPSVMNMTDKSLAINEMQNLIPQVISSGNSKRQF